jgi:hypothetical protein
VRSPRGCRLAGATVYHSSNVSHVCEEVKKGVRADFVEHEYQPLALLQGNLRLQRPATIRQRVVRVENLDYDVCFVEDGGEMR